MKKRKLSRVAASGVAFVAFAVAPAMAHNDAGQANGEAGQLGSAISMWEETAADGRVTAIGIEVPLSVIEGAADLEAGEFGAHLSVLPFSPEAKRDTQVDHVSFDWMPLGHPPERYVTPHFDIHFYFDDGEALAGYDCATVVYPDPALVPAGFVLPPEGDPHACVPAMGVHAVLLDDVTTEGVFDAVTVLGYYDGRYTFVEPMVSREHLLERESFTLAVPVVENGTEAMQPDTVRFDYDADSDSYRIALTGYGEAR